MLIVLCDIYYVTCNGMCNGVFFINKDYKKSCEQMSLIIFCHWLNAYNEIAQIWGDWPTSLSLKTRIYIRSVPISIVFFQRRSYDDSKKTSM